MKVNWKLAMPAFLLSGAIVLAPGNVAWAQGQSRTQTEVAKLDGPAQPPGTAANSTSTDSAPEDSPSVNVGQKSPLAVTEELEALKKRIEELEAELGGRTAAQPASPAPAASAAETQPAVGPAADAASDTDADAASDEDADATLASPATPQTAAPASAAPKTGLDKWFGARSQDDVFAYPGADWTWMNGNGRQHDAPLASKYFTPEFRADTNVMLDGNHPSDDTMGGSTESFRTGEFQVEQISLGGNINVGNARGRILTMFGLFATTTPRNDGSVAKGQWDLADAYRYVSEAWGGYHFNVNHGLNVDAGIFVSYIGLFSYYNFDNWTYQPSFVSSNTPWFFNGLRIQWFPTNKLKIEPWLINGWQSYARFNGPPGAGGQILWRPKPWLSFVFNNYGLGQDTLGVPRSRIHTDNSVEVRLLNHPDKPLDMVAISFTGDLGCEYGSRSGVSCFGDTKDGPKQSFMGWMEYNRFQFHKDMFGITLGGGVLDNPGRYLTLLPPINGATAITGSPYFQAYPGSTFHGWDTTFTFDYMPSQFMTFRWEAGYRHSNESYWSGHGGITPPGGNNGSPADYVCANGMSSGVTGGGAGTAADLPAVEAACGPLTGLKGASSVWFPDLVHGQMVGTFAVMVRF
jgi:hypothetical protein